MIEDIGLSMNGKELLMTTEIQDKIIVCVSGEDMHIDYNDFGLSFDSTDGQVLEAIAPLVQERFSVDLGHPGSWLYKTRKATNSRNIYVIPNSTAG